MDFVPSPATLLAFTGASFLLAITPGPDMALMLSRTLAGGRRLGFATIAGCSVGLVCHALLAGFGLSALLAASATAFAVAKMVGAVYLLWLAWQALRHGSALSMAPGEATPQQPWAAFLTGLGINLTNPKVVLFFVTFLPQFVDPADPHAAGQMLFLGFWFLVVGTPTCCVIVLTAERFTAFMRRSRRLTRAFDMSFAGLMGGFALRLLLAQAR
ncbi:LysE family translocator [Alsobacter soli]|uniref:LysE family translocator n=1 Tax=Alsobacter soli TaxID=2109933 RepID=A0A2T1HZR3_9HYPH|nr:LysE family translocator [Alsobacter soli]PSC07114.1 LysE family translocator [Alsobacter soli]